MEEQSRERTIKRKTSDKEGRIDLYRKTCILRMEKQSGKRKTEGKTSDKEREGVIYIGRQDKLRLKVQSRRGAREEGRLQQK